MKYSRQDFLNELTSIISELQQELTEREAGINGDGTIEQLRLFINELKGISDMVTTNTMPPKGQRSTAFTWYIVDSWNHNSKLGNKLCDLADKYKRKI